MGVIKNNEAKSTVEYTVELDAIKKLIAKDLEVPEEEIDVRYVIDVVNEDPMDRFPGNHVVTRVKVTHTKKIKNAEEERHQR